MMCTMKTGSRRWVGEEIGFVASNAHASWWKVKFTAMILKYSYAFPFPEGMQRESTKFHTLVTERK